MPAAAALALTIAGSTLGAIGSIVQGQQQAAAARENARVAEAQAKAEKQAAEYKAEAQIREHRKLLGRQKALFGAAGVDLTSGSPLMVMSEDAGLAAQDVFMTRLEGENKRIQYMNQAKLYRQQARDAKTSALWSAGTTLLTGLASGINSYATLSALQKE